MFDNLKEGLKRAIKSARGQANLSEENLEPILKEIRNSLLEADVSLKAVQGLLKSLKGKLLGAEVPTHLTVEQFFVRAVKEELTSMMGGVHEPINLRAQPPAIVLLCGLQGSGKTTFAAKLAKYLLETQKKKSIALVSTDTRRPAAMEQLSILGEKAGVPVMRFEEGLSALEIAKRAKKEAELRFLDVLIVDTAGRSSLDEETELMKEIKDLNQSLKPVERYLVVDAMLGQDAFALAQGFDEAFGITAICLTKADGDARGGAALSAHYITGKPIKFLSVGEKVDALEAFHPERIVGQILGMGDVLGLIEKVERKMDYSQQRKFMKKAQQGGMNLADFREQINQMKELGSMEEIMSKLPIPSHLSAQVSNAKPERTMKRYAALIDSMTSKERLEPEILDASRKKRIAMGSGIPVSELNQLLKQFKQMSKMMKKMGSMQKMARMMGGLGMGSGSPFSR